jgi:hypothetical protein
MAPPQQEHSEISLSMPLEVIDAWQAYGSDIMVVGGRLLLLERLRHVHRVYRAHGRFDRFEAE